MVNAEYINKKLETNCKAVRTQPDLFDYYHGQNVILQNMAVDLNLVDNLDDLYAGSYTEPTVLKKRRERAIIERIIEMATPSLDPDSYTELLDIMQRLSTTRNIGYEAF